MTDTMSHSLLCPLLLLALGCGGGTDDLPPKPVKPGPAAAVSSPKVVVRAVAGAMQVTVPAGTHSVADPQIYVGDYNVYPADNAVVLQGVARGPIGDQASTEFWLTGVHDGDAGSSYLEAVMVYAVECDDCPGEDVVTERFDSLRSPPDKPAYLLGVDAMRVEDLDGDGRFELVCEARFQPCCDGGSAEQSYSETIILTAKGTTIERLPSPEQ